MGLNIHGMFGKYLVKNLGGVRRYSTGRKATYKIIGISSAVFVTGFLTGTGYMMYSTLNNVPAFLFPLSSKTGLKDLSSPQYIDVRFEVDKFDDELRRIVASEDVSTSENDIDTHSFNNYTLHKPSPEQRPHVIVYPRSTEHVSQIMKLCHKYRVPVIPFSGGTSIEGQFVTTRNKGRSQCSCSDPTITLVLDFNRHMNNVLQVNADDMDCVVQPGVVTKELNDNILEPLGLIFGPDGAPGCEIGGQIGTSCSGTNAYRYGTMKENVINVTAVMADGTIIKTKNRPKKSSNGYNLTGLFIGSEGTLGVITEATIKLHVKPIYETISIVSFPTLQDATKLVQRLNKMGINNINAVELLDGNMMKAINFSGQTARVWDENPTLLFKIGSHSKNILKETIKDVGDLAYQQGCITFESAKTLSQQEELWSARKSIFWSSIDYGRHLFGENVKIWSTDIAVPISKLPNVIDETLAEIIGSGLYGTIVGHVGDGNFHCLVMYDDETEQKAMQLIDSMNYRALKNEGTCSGEHGIGISKRKFLELELGTDTISVMRKIKMALDSQRIMNPDKLFKIDPRDNKD